MVWKQMAQDAKFVTKLDISIHNWQLKCYFAKNELLCTKNVANGLIYSPQMWQHWDRVKNKNLKRFGCLMQRRLQPWLRRSARLALDPRTKSVSVVMRFGSHFSPSRLTGWPCFEIRIRSVVGDSLSGPGKNLFRGLSLNSDFNFRLSECFGVIINLLSSDSISDFGNEKINFEWSRAFTHTSSSNLLLTFSAPKFLCIFFKAGSKNLVT